MNNFFINLEFEELFSCQPFCHVALDTSFGHVIPLYHHRLRTAGFVGRIYDHSSPARNAYHEVK